MGYETSNEPDLEIYNRLGEWRKRKRVDTSTSSEGTSSELNPFEDVSTADVQTLKVSCQTVTMDVTTVACQTDAEVDEEDYKQLQMKVSIYEKVSLSEEYLKNNGQKLKFYTGILSAYS